jgi:hypothetical protein
MKDLDFGKVLMFHQALGRAQLQQIESQQHAAINKLSHKIGSLLERLLPERLDSQAKPYDIHGVMVNIVQSAVRLANSMAQELAIFRPFFLTPGEEAIEEKILVSNDEQFGNVWLCTFPGFSRKIRGEDGKTKYGVLVRASAELDSHYRREAA